MCSQHQLHEVAVKIREAIGKMSLALCLAHKRMVRLFGCVARQIYRQSEHPDAVFSVQATAALYNTLGFQEHHAMELFVEYRP